jgi:hypothetical protein
MRKDMNRVQSLLAVLAVGLTGCVATAPVQPTVSQAPASVSGNIAHTSQPTAASTPTRPQQNETPAPVEFDFDRFSNKARSHLLPLNIRNEADKLRQNQVVKRSTMPWPVKYDWYFFAYDGLEKSVPPNNKTTPGGGCIVDFNAAKEIALLSRAEVYVDFRQDVAIRMPQPQDMRLFWVGNCVNGIGQGPGVFVLYYIDRLPTEMPWYFERVFADLKDGKMHGSVDLVSESQFIPTYRQRNRVAVAENGRLKSEAFSQALEQRVKNAEKARGAISALMLSTVAKAAQSLQSAPNSPSIENPVRVRMTGSANQATRPQWSKGNQTFECISGRERGYKSIVDLRDSGNWQNARSLVRYKTAAEAAEAACPQ